MISEEKRKKERKLKELTKHARVFRDRVAGGKKRNGKREKEGDGNGEKAYRYINYCASYSSVLRATLNYKTDKFIPWDTGQTSGIPRLINEPLIPTFYLTRASTSRPLLARVLVQFA